MNINQVMEIVEKTLDNLYENEEYLFKNDVSERNLVFHFSRYFYYLFEKYNSDKKYSIDCEYNRNTFNERKYKELIYEGKIHKIYPDFILHQRGYNDNNILAIEFKKYNNTDKREKNKDFMKLKALTDLEACYKYKLGFWRRFGKTREKFKIFKFSKGKII